MVTSDGRNMGNFSGQPVLMNYFFRYAMSVTMYVTYGMRITSLDDKVIDAHEKIGECQFILYAFNFNN